MRLIVLSFFCAISMLCISQRDAGIANHFKGKTYQQFLNTTASELSKIRTNYAQGTASQKDSILTATGDFLCETLVHGGFHYWIGTTWDFNGYTNVPGQGTIACGYFVSTTLKHIGFNLNRYKLAQKSAMDEARYLCGEEYMEIYRSISTDSLRSIFKQSYPKGLYKLGLANHVGYLYYDETELYFIHSNYGTPYSVVMEKFCESEVSSSSIYVVSRLSTNKDLMRKWIEKEWINVP